MARPQKKQSGPRKPADRSAPQAAPAKENKPPLTGLETEIMQVVWRLGTVSAAEVREALSPDRPLARTTILTVLENLRKKKAVRVVPTVGREKKFRAAVAKEAIAGQLLGSLRGRFFNGSAASLVAHLIKNGDVDKRELEEIREVIERSKGSIAIGMKDNEDKRELEEIREVIENSKRGGREQ
jgi:predicted transcriptional regulator